jgi:hypothetical protein
MYISKYEKPLLFLFYSDFAFLFFTDKSLELLKFTKTGTFKFLGCITDIGVGYTRAFVPICHTLEQFFLNCGLPGGLQSVSEEKELQKSYQTLN